MEEEQIAPIIEQIKEALPDIEESKIRSEMERYLKYGILAQEAKKAIIRKFGGTSTSFSPLGEKTLEELKGGEMNIDLTVRCLSSKERMHKTVNGEKTLIFGLLADRTMIKKFVSWEGHLLEKGIDYLIKGASAKLFRGEVEINLGGYTKVEDAPDGALDDLDVSKLPRFGNLQVVELKDIRPGMGNIQITAKVMNVEERTIDTERGPKKIYDGMLADDTKRMRFTSWSDPSMEIGDVVTIRGAYVKEWRGIPQINFDDRAEVEKEKDRDFDVMKTPRLRAEDLINAGATDVEVKGTVIEIRDGSGLITRCPECNRALMNGSCSIHGDQEGKVDLRTKVVLDDGTGSLFAVLNTEITEELLGKSVAECVDKYRDDEERVVYLLGRKLLGREMIMKGNVIKDDFGPTMLPSQVKEDEEDYMDEIKTLFDIVEVI
ncbi:MAG: hypothetical protein U9R75_12845 [Candidatus Thermoplasmatota archaeon]|nr:hypothetical protein [Candidatus Thermoplasmatota archaeon]